MFFELVANFAFFFMVFLSKRTLLLITAVLAAWLVYYHGFVYPSPPGWKEASFVGGGPRVGFTFLIGVLIFKYFDFIKSLPRIHYLVLVGVLIALMSHPLFSRFGDHWLLSTVFAVPLLVAFGTIATIKSDLANKVLDQLGRLSYPVYCLHTPIAAIVSVFYIEKLTAPLVVFLIGSIYLVTFFFTKFYDEPFRKYLTKNIFFSTKKVKGMV